MACTCTCTCSHTCTRQSTSTHTKTDKTQCTCTCTLYMYTSTCLHMYMYMYYGKNLSPICTYITSQGLETNCDALWYGPDKYMYMYYGAITRGEPPPCAVYVSYIHVHVYVSYVHHITNITGHTSGTNVNPSHVKFKGQPERLQHSLAFVTLHSGLTTTLG